MDAVRRPFDSNCTAYTSPRKHLKVLETSTGRQLTLTVKYAGDLVLLAREETVLQGMFVPLVETGKIYGFIMNL
jgi:hypothetical protein